MKNVSFALMAVSALALFSANSYADESALYSCDISVDPATTVGDSYLEAKGVALDLYSSPYEKFEWSAERRIESLKEKMRIKFGKIDVPNMGTGNVAQLMIVGFDKENPESGHDGDLLAVASAFIPGTEAQGFIISAVHQLRMYRAVCIKK